MTTWTNELVKNSNGEVHVKFTSSAGQSFTKIYKEEYTDTFLVDKLSIVTARQSVYDSLQSMIDVEFIIRDGWIYKFFHVCMQSDYVEIWVDVKSPYQDLRKIYETTNITDMQGLSDYIDNEKAILNALIDAEDMQGLEDYFGKEVILNG